MPKPHFAIEPPRKIRICIEGYDAHARTQAQRRKQQERRERLARRAAFATSAAQPGADLLRAPEAGIPAPPESIPPTPADPPAPAGALAPQLQDALS